MQLVERTFIYAFNAPSIPGGQSLLEQEITILPDAAFLARGAGAFTPAGALLSPFSLRFADASRRYRSNVLLSVAGEFPNITTMEANFAPIIPQILYPPNSVLVLDLRNDLGGPTQPVILFQGVNLYRRGTIWAPRLPPRFTIGSFSYTIPVQISVGSTATLLADQILVVRPDAGFMLTHAQFEVDASQGIASVTDLRIQLKDNQGKFYSNDYIPIDMLTGQNQAERPGLFYPGIYIEPNSWLWFNLKLNDTGAAGTLFLQIAFEGYKVFPL